MKSEQKPSSGPAPDKPVPAEEQKEQKGQAVAPAPTGTTQVPETTPGEERGERLATGKTIARGGKTTGDVPGATPSKG